MPSNARAPTKRNKNLIFDFSGRLEILDCAEYHQHLKSKILNLKSYIFLTVTLKTSTN